MVLLGRTIPGFSKLIDTLGKIFRTKVSLEMIDFPMTRFFRRERKQYEADVLLSELARFTSPAELTVFIIQEDMYSEPLNFVFGLAKGSACIVSTARLDPRFYGEVKDMSAAAALFKERLLKEILHELGHLYGLPHCENKKCVMVFSNDIHGVDFKGVDFCPKCRKALYLE